MEYLNFKDLNKVQLLVVFAAVAYVFSLLNGLIKEGIKPAVIKKFLDKKARSISLFRLGYDHLKTTMHILTYLKDFLIEILTKSIYGDEKMVFSHKNGW